MAKCKSISGVSKWDYGRTTRNVYLMTAIMGYFHLSLRKWSLALRSSHSNDRVIVKGKGHEFTNDSPLAYVLKVTAESFGCSSQFTVVVRIAGILESAYYKRRKPDGHMNQALGRPLRLVHPVIIYAHVDFAVHRIARYSIGL